MDTLVLKVVEYDCNGELGEKEGAGGLDLAGGSCSPVR